MNVKYGYLGPKGTYSEDALQTYLGDAAALMVPFPTIEQVISAVRCGDVTHGLVPLENSIEGTVNLTLDHLAWNEELTITGEIVLSVSQNLLISPGTAKDTIKSVVSHPQALAQCRQYLNENFPGVELCEVSSTAEAARIAASGKAGTAAIGNYKAAQNYGLALLEKDIQDCRENKTRFVMVAKEQVPVTGQAKTSVVISITDRPGGLYQILHEFAIANINLTKIESRPAKTVLGDYLFFIDLLGHRDDPEVRKCLESIEDMAASFRILGSYPAWTEARQQDTGGQKANISMEEIRQDIDIIDYQIVELLARRTQLVTQIGKLKNGWNTCRDKNRESEVMNRVRRNAVKRGVSPQLVEKIYDVLFDHFVGLQEQQQVE